MSLSGIEGPILTGFNQEGQYFLAIITSVKLQLSGKALFTSPGTRVPLVGFALRETSAPQYVSLSDYRAGQIDNSSRHRI